MALTEKEVNHIAVLARIELSDAMRKRMCTDLSSILDYIEMLSGVPTEGIKPLYQVTGLTDRTRSDEHRDDFPASEEMDALLTGQAPHLGGPSEGQAPQRQDRTVKVRSVLKK